MAPGPDSAPQAGAAGRLCPVTLDGWLAYIESLHPQAIAFGLERVEAVFARMGIAFACPVITVGGTNGKGSTCALLEAMLRAAGYRYGDVHLSAHLALQRACVSRRSGC